MISTALTLKLRTALRELYPTPEAIGAFLTEAPEAHFETLKKVLVNIPGLQAPKTTSEERKAEHQRLIEGLAGAAVVVLNAVLTTRYVAGTPEYVALRNRFCPIPTLDWGIPGNLPQEVEDLLDTTAWKARYDALGAMSDRIPFATVKDSASLALDALVAMGLGGVQDAKDPDVLNFFCNTATMNACVRVLLRKLRLRHPLWFAANGSPVDALPEGVSGDSYADVVAAREAEEEARQEAARAAARVQQRENERAAWRAFVDGHTDAFLSISDNANATVAAAKGLLEHSFEDLKAKAGELIELNEAYIGMWRAYASDKGEQVQTELSALAVQAVFTAAKISHPHYFDTNADGDIVLRRALPKPKEGFGRDEGAILRAVLGVVKKYGTTAVAQALKGRVTVTDGDVVVTITRDDLAKLSDSFRGWVISGATETPTTSVSA